MSSCLCKSVIGTTLEEDAFISVLNGLNLADTICMADFEGNVVRVGRIFLSGGIETPV